MEHPAPDPTETYLRIYRRSMFLILILIAAIGAIVFSSVLWPDRGLSRWLAQTPWVIPVLSGLALAAQQGALRRHRLSPDAPEFRAIQHDEWRRKGMTRASRGALVAVLGAQVPLALLLVGLPTVRAVWGMAGLTITLGMAAQVGLSSGLRQDLRGWTTRDWPTRSRSSGRSAS